MQDRQVFEQVLGIVSPWFVADVELALEEGEVRVPWAEPLSRFTMLYERLVIAWMKEASQSAVAEQFRLSWDEVHGIMERAVERGLGRRKAEVAKNREKASLDGFWKTLTQEQLDGIVGVAIDMWDRFEDSIREHVPDPDEKIVYDRFQNPMGQSHRARLPQFRQLYHSHLLPLRRPRPQSLPLKSQKNVICTR